MSVDCLFFGELVLFMSRSLNCITHILNCIMPVLRIYICDSGLVKILYRMFSFRLFWFLFALAGSQPGVILATPAFCGLWFLCQFNFQSICSASLCVQNMYMTPGVNSLLYQSIFRSQSICYATLGNFNACATQWWAWGFMQRFRGPFVSTTLNPMTSLHSPVPRGFSLRYSVLRVRVWGSQCHLPLPVTWST